MADVVILGAHSPVGRSIHERLADRDASEGVVVATTTEHVTDDLVLMDEALIARTGLLVLAMTDPLAVRVAAGLGQRGTDVLDAAEALDGPYVWPSLTGGAPTSGLARIAVGPAAPVAAAIASLAVFRPTHASITTLESAVARGQAGMDELSAHTRAVFAMQDVDPEVFPASLAFDPIPSLAYPDDDPDDADDALAEQVQDALRQLDAPSPPVLAVTRVLVPTFVADAAIVHLVTEDPQPELDTVVAALSGARSLRHVPRAVLPALDAVDRDDVLVGRVRVAPHRVELWLAYDRTRAGSAVPAALAIEAWQTAHRSGD